MPLFLVLFGVLPDFLVPLWAIPGFWVSFLVKFDFLRIFQILGIDFDISLTTLWNTACRALVSNFLQSDLAYSCKIGWQ